MASNCLMSIPPPHPKDDFKVCILFTEINLIQVSTHVGKNVCLSIHYICRSKYIFFFEYTSKHIYSVCFCSYSKANFLL